DGCRRNLAIGNLAWGTVGFCLVMAPLLLARAPAPPSDSSKGQDASEVEGKRAAKEAKREAKRFMPKFQWSAERDKAYAARKKREATAHDLAPLMGFFLLLALLIYACIPEILLMFFLRFVVRGFRAWGVVDNCMIP